MSVGYGVGMWCADELRLGRLARGKVLLGLAAYRRLITPRGTLQDGDEGSVYGIDISDYIGDVGPRIAGATIADIVRAELAKDDRFAEVTVRRAVTQNPNGSLEIELDVTIIPADGSEDFTLTLSASEAGVAFGGIK